MLRSLRKRRIVQHALLCTTLDGQDCDLITITGDADELPGVVELSSSAPSFLRRKKTVILSARVHPGETPASWMMRGILDFLVGDSHEARILRALFVFKIVPMLNPDGVLYGNNRCSLAGVDLNR
jgi:murein tripeptide amidase MpaA